MLTACVSAIWLGILTSISPCPMATNIAAVSFISKSPGSPLRIIITGILYAAGRMLAYLLLGWLLVACCLSASSMSQLLQRYMNQALGPLLVIVGMVLLGLIEVKPREAGAGDRMKRAVDLFGVWGALPVGFVFAASMCPVSAAIFFGSLLSLAIRMESAVAVPVLYGAGTAVPVLFLSMLLAVGGRKIGTAFNKAALFERWARIVTGAVIIVVGVYYALRYIFDVF